MMIGRLIPLLRRPSQMSRRGNAQNRNLVREPEALVLVFFVDLIGGRNGALGVLFVA